MPAEHLNANVTLDRLLAGLAETPAIPVSGLSSDSRCLREGYVFIACHGRTSHGLEFLSQAVEAKVAAVVWDSSTGAAPSADIPMFAVEDLASHVGTIANRFFEEAAIFRFFHEGGRKRYVFPAFDKIDHEGDSFFKSRLALLRVGGSGIVDPINTAA